MNIAQLLKAKGRAVTTARPHAKMTDIIASPSNPVFVGQTWTVGTAPTDISSCDDAGSPQCNFSN